MRYANHRTCRVKRSGSLLLELSISLALSALLMMLYAPLATLCIRDTHKKNITRALALNKALYEILREIRRAGPLNQITVITPTQVQWQNNAELYTLSYERGRLILHKKNAQSILLLLPHIDAATLSLEHRSRTHTILRVMITQEHSSTTGTYPLYIHE